MWHLSFAIVRLMLWHSKNVEWSFEFIGPNGKFVCEFAKLGFRVMVVTITSSCQTADSQARK